MSEIYDKLKSDFDKRCAADDTLKNLLEKIDSKKGDFKDAAKIAQRYADIMAQTITDDLRMTDTRLTGDLADEILNGLGREIHGYVNNALCSVQRSLDAVAGINLQPQQAAYPARRMNAIVEAVKAAAEDADIETLTRRITTPAQTVIGNFTNNYIQKNAKYRHKAGLKVTLTREDVGGCCAWCKNLAGTYDYEKIPKDIYRRHDNCRCTVTYQCGDMQQNVWSKQTWQADDDTLAKRQQLSDRQPKRR